MTRFLVPHLLTIDLILLFIRANMDEMSNTSGILLPITKKDAVAWLRDGAIRRPDWTADASEYEPFRQEGCLRL